MKTEEFIQTKEYWVEFIGFSKKHCEYTDEDLAEHIVKMMKKAINYSQCCTELKDKKEMTFDKWLKNNGYNLVKATYASKHLHLVTREFLWQKYIEEK